MKTLFVAVVSIAISVAARVSLKAGMSSVGMKEILVQPYTLRSVFSIITGKFVLGVFLMGGS
ncbi:MAG: hypothetical protein AB2L11_04060 [Syntrophobacteraceae bacterium]